MSKTYWFVKLVLFCCCYCCARCPNPRAGREKASKTMQLAKRGSLLLTRARALCRIQRSGAGQRARAQAVIQIYRVSTCLWFKQIGYKFAKQFHWSKLSRWRDFPGGFSPVPNFLIGKQWSVLSES